MKKENADFNKDDIKSLMQKAIKMLCEKNISEIVILSSYKINSLIAEKFGVNIKIERVGRILSNIAKRNGLKRLSTNIPKYRLKLSKFPTLSF